jgi:hypothetical protein
MNLRWFNWSGPRFCGVRLWNLFNRRSTDGHFWGVGILQWRKRHLCFIGHCGVSVLFIGETE